MRRWLNFDSDRGGVAWGILCCWIGVISNLILLSLGVTIFYIVPWTLFGVPALASALIWAASRRGCDR
jgi:hypothetical protein